MTGGSKHVVIVGAGGNIGSHAVPHVGRMAEIGRVTVIDRDTYEARNLQAQDMLPGDAGRAKVEVQARRLRRINPGIGIRAINDDVENVPLTALRGDVILTGLDSRRARQIVNERAWRLGVPWIDAGVDGDGLLARITVYVPGRERPCIECGWGPRDYDALEQRFPCGGAQGEPAATNASSGLGALAASLLVTEGNKFLAGDFHRVTCGRDVLIDAAHHNYYVSRREYNPHCRLPGHRLEPLETTDSCPVGALLGDLLGPGGGDIEVVGQSFVTRLRCKVCGARRNFVRLQASLRTRAHYKCHSCGGDMVAAGFDCTNVLEVARPPRMLRRSLQSIGVRKGDIVRVMSAGAERFVEVSAATDTGAS
jgi:adenylyltransferase/sulfurtransferase